MIDADTAITFHGTPARRTSRSYTHAWVAIFAAFAVLVAAGCGSKPAYCTDRTDLVNSVKDLPSSATSGGISGLKTQLTTIEAQAKTLASSAKTDFPTETSAVESSVNQLSTAVKALPANPSSTQIAAIAIEASAVVNSVKSFTSATDSKCK